MSESVLEKSAQVIADASPTPPFLYQLGPEGARKALDDIQSAPTGKIDMDVNWITIPADVGDVRVRIVKPVVTSAVLPTILSVYGGGWILGNSHTHDMLIRSSRSG